MHIWNIGIDAGGTLVKLALEHQGEIQYRKFDSHQLEQVADWLNNEHGDARLCMTGGKAAALQALLRHRNIDNIVEFDATCEGVRYLLSASGETLSSFILTNVGTGTSIHYINGQTHLRVGGTGVGGGTIVGLSILLTGVASFEEIVRSARAGRRQNVDLTVGDIYKGAEPPLSGDLTASNFGSIRALTQRATSQPDLLAALIGLVGETVTTASIFAADKHGTSDIVYIGSSFIDNDVLETVIAAYSRFKGTNPIFVHNGEYSGATGALSSIAHWPAS